MSSAMHPLLSSQLAHEHRKDLLRSADRWRRQHPRATSTRRVGSIRRLRPSWFEGVGRRPSPACRLASDGSC